MHVSYGRVSPRDQRAALQAAGRDEIFIDKAAGKLAHRPELDKPSVSRVSAPSRSA
ncbi:MULTISPECIES: hypothetical protein [Pseudofrankia]|uniref:hypothetical protein n=1 Tax=Pseudofrankia TaxID=2994363 RepID=UPI0003067A85|nr:MULTISPECIES: hypothetical protein [Pseudofrankia]